MFIGSNILIPRLSLYGSNSLGDYLYTLRLEAENASRNVITANGDAQLDGDGAVVFDGTGDYLAVPHNEGMVLGSGDFTISCGVVATAVGQSNNSEIIVKHENATQMSGFAVDLEAGTYNLRFKSSSNGSTFNVAENIPIGTLTPGIEASIVICRNGSSIRLFFNGVLANTVTTSDTLYDAGRPLLIGGGNFASTYTTGKISRVHYSVGIARYTTDDSFTPPTDTIVPDQYTVLALNFDGDAASTRILDLAKPAYGVESPAATPFLPDISGNEHDALQATASLQPLYDPTLPKMTFDGTGDYMTPAQNINQNSRPFTIYFVYEVASGFTDGILFGDDQSRVRIDSNGNIVVTSDNGVDIVNTLTESDARGSKNIIALEYNTTGFRLFLNGTQELDETVPNIVNVLTDYGLGAEDDGTTSAAMDFYGCYVTSELYSPSLNGLISSKYGV